MQRAFPPVAMCLKCAALAAVQHGGGPLPRAEQCAAGKDLPQSGWQPAFVLARRTGRRCCRPPFRATCMHVPRRFARAHWPREVAL